MGEVHCRDGLFGRDGLAEGTICPIMPNDETQVFAVQLLDEVWRLPRHQASPLRPDFRDAAMQIWKGFSPESRGSMAVDLDAGRPLALEWISGRIHKFALDNGVPTPAHSAAYRGLLLHSEGKIARRIKRRAPKRAQSSDMGQVLWDSQVRGWFRLAPDSCPRGRADRIHTRAIHVGLAMSVTGPLVL